jgi:hypothetical protein
MMKMVAAFCFFLSISSFATEKTTGEKIKDGAVEMGQDIKKGTNKAVRKVKDETCELINGKMECAVKKGAHKVQNTVDEAKDKMND